MTQVQWIFGAATLLAALALWLLLPRGTTRHWINWIGVVLGLASLGLFGSQLPRLVDWPTHVLFLLLAGMTVIASVATVTVRNPVYCAIWFAVSLLGTAGLFLLQGAQFLGVATIVVYAGAILVTFLFVLMLAQPRGQAYYDRLSWEALWSAAAGALLIGVFSAVILGAFRGERAEGGRALIAISAEGAEPDRATGVLTESHVAELGGQLFSRHLIAVEVAGVLLLAALVGATAIVAHGRQTPRPEKDVYYG